MGDTDEPHLQLQRRLGLGRSCNLRREPILFGIGIRIVKLQTFGRGVLLANTKRHVKVLFPLQENETTIKNEILWTVDLGDDIYQLDSCPFFVYNISLGDLICAKIQHENQPFVFQRVVSKSGNRTIRIFFEVSVGEGITSEILETLKSSGCGYEGYVGGRYFSINVPPAISYDQICERLSSNGIDWEDADRF